MAGVGVDVDDVTWLGRAEQQGTKLGIGLYSIKHLEVHKSRHQHYLRSDSLEKSASEGLRYE